jgi:hypothetical protein
MDYNFRLSRAAAALAASLCVLLCGAARADGTTSPYPDADGLGVKWWQHVLSIPAPRNPFFDTTGQTCGDGQSGYTWYLYSSSVGAPGETVHLKCTIPAGRRIFVAFIVAICIPFPGETIPQNIEFCREGSDVVDILELKIDGKRRNDLVERRAETRPFSVDLPKDNAFGYPPGVVLAVHEGFFARVPPLEPGVHTLRVRGGISSIGLEFDTSYRLEIVRPARTLSSTP